MLPEVARSNPPINIKSDDFPEPLGPTSPTLSPIVILSEIWCNISTMPAFPLSEREASVRDKAVMDQSFDIWISYGYGALRSLRKGALMAILTTGAVNAETKIIAILGDSLVQGYGLPIDQGLVPQLQAWLDAQGADLKIINAGVSGDTTAGGLSRVEWTLSEDLDAMIVALGGNDFLRGIPPEVSRSNLKGIVETAQLAGVETMIVALEASSNYGPDFKVAFDSMYSDIALEYDASLYPGFFNAIFDAGEDDWLTYMQNDGIHPNAQGVSLIVNNFGPFILEWMKSN